jgi:hypothetical protein
VAVYVAGQGQPVPETISYTVTADGDANTTTTQLTFTFSKAVSGLTADNITISESGVTKGALTGGGTNWSLALTVDTAQNATVAIYKDGIESGQKPVKVYVAGDPVPPTAWTVTADGDENTPTAALVFTFSAPVSGLTADDIDSNSGIIVTKGALTGDGTSWSLALIVEADAAKSYIAVFINKAGIVDWSEGVWLYSQTTPITYEVTANGNANTTTTALAFTFSEAVSGLSIYDIHISYYSGVTKGELTGEGKNWSLALTVEQTTDIMVSISKVRIDNSQKTVKVYVKGQVSYEVTANGHPQTTRTTALDFTFSEAVSDLTADNISIISHQSVQKGALTGEGKNWSLALTVEWTTDITVAINKAGIENGQKSVEVYAPRYTVSYSVGEGSGSPPYSMYDVLVGEEITLPGQNEQGIMTAPPGKIFGGWQNGGDSYQAGQTWPVSADVTFTARWIPAPPVPDNLSLADSLAWLEENAVDGGNYTITLSGDETIAPHDLLYEYGQYERQTVSITLKGDSTNRTVHLSETGSLFTVGQNVTLILDSNITLQGRSDNTAPLVSVHRGGTLEMKTGSKISDNTFAAAFSYYGGGGVYVGGTFTMSGGEISGNTASSSSSSSFSSSNVYGGGVYVASDSEFTMSGGEISGNTASSSSSSSNACGGGVYVDSNGTFTKQVGGIIYGQDASDPALRNTVKNFSFGHAVYVSDSHYRNSTAGNSVILDSRDSGATGGWIDTVPDNLPHDKALEWFGGNRVTNTEYTITVKVDEYETIGPYSLSSGSPVNITLKGDSTNRTVWVSFLTVENNVTLILDSNITLVRGSSTTQLIRVDSGGKLEMRADSKIGGGVYVASDSEFTMSGGEISDNSASASSSTAYGGGVYVDSNGTFTMSGGTISSNSAASSHSYGDGVYVASNGTFTMNDGIISDNEVYVYGIFTMENGTISDSTDRGVYVASNGTFTMNNGTISDNTSSSNGGGVYVDNNGTFTMNGGKISNNSSSYSYGGGGGVYVNDIFAMSGGEISGNTTSYDNHGNSNSDGGGVYVDGIFTMSGGEISGNTSCGGKGDGVYVASGGFAMDGGTISDNTSSSNGGGVYVDSNGTFTMNNGTISNNIASSDGGGVYVDNGTFTMNGGTISGNTANYGGGVYVIREGVFTKQGGGTIYGSNANVTQKNTATNGNGNAVYVASTPPPAKKRNTTAGVGVTLDSAKNGQSGGWD